MSKIVIYKYILALLFLAFSENIFSQQAITTDSLTKYLYGKWYYKEWKCWEKNYTDTVYREANFDKNILQIKESYNNDLVRKQIGEIKFKNINNWFELKIQLKNETNDTINTVILNMKIIDKNKFSVYWNDAYYKNEEQRLIHGRGNYIFIRK